MMPVVSMLLHRNRDVLEAKYLSPLSTNDILEGITFCWARACHISEISHSKHFQILNY